jgi:hypothetical protein
MAQFLRRKRAGLWQKRAGFEPAGGRLPCRSRPVRHGPAGKDAPFETRSIPAQSAVSGPSSFRFARVSMAVERRTSVLAAASVRTVVANSRYSAACARSSIADCSVIRAIALPTPAKPSLLSRPTAWLLAHTSCRAVQGFYDTVRPAISLLGFVVNVTPGHLGSCPDCYVI